MRRIEINTNITTYHTQRHSVTIRTPSHITNGFLEVKKQCTIDIFSGMTDLLSSVCVPDVPVYSLECIFCVFESMIIYSRTMKRTYYRPHYPLSSIVRLVTRHRTTSVLNRYFSDPQNVLRSHSVTWFRVPERHFPPQGQ